VNYVKEVSKMVEDTIVEVDSEAIRQAVEEEGLSLRDVTNMMVGIKVNPDYLSKRLKKSSMPMNVLNEVCRIVKRPIEDFAIPYDLSAVPSYQMIEELMKRREMP
jgi:hypothetical protein